MTTTPTHNRGIAVFSGGSAANNLVDVFSAVRESKQCSLSYIIPISDNGGSSSELIRIFGGPGIGDVRSTFLFLRIVFILMLINQRQTRPANPGISPGFRTRSHQDPNQPPTSRRRRGCSQGLAFHCGWHFESLEVDYARKERADPLVLQSTEPGDSQACSPASLNL